MHQRMHVAPLLRWTVSCYPKQPLHSEDLHAPVPVLAEHLGVPIATKHHASFAGRPVICCLCLTLTPASAESYVQSPRGSEGPAYA